MNYGMFGVSNSPEETGEVVPIGQPEINFTNDDVVEKSQIKLYQKALLMERLREEY